DLSTPEIFVARIATLPHVRREKVREASALRSSREAPSAPRMGRSHFDPRARSAMLANSRQQQSASIASFDELRSMERRAARRSPRDAARDPEVASDVTRAASQI